MRARKQLGILTFTLVSLGLVSTGCGTNPDSTTSPTVVTASEAPASAPPASASSHATTQAACAIKKAGWYLHPTYLTLCYYAEIYPGCSQGVYAYNRRVSNGILVTKWGQEFAYACHPKANGEWYRGQWAIGASASTVDVHQYPRASGYGYLPRVAGY